MGLTRAPVLTALTMLVLMVLILVLTDGTRAEEDVGQPPRIIEHPSDTTVPRLSPVTLNCQASGAPRPDVRWVKDGRPVTPATHRMQLPRGSLFLLSVRRRDAGVYWCTARNRHGTDTSRNATLLVAVLRDEFRAWPLDTEATEGDRVTLECSPPKGDPPPTVRWLRNDKPLDLFNNHRYRLAREGALVIENVTRADAGEYVCEARNYAQMKRLTDPARLIVHARPLVSSSNSNRDGSSNGGIVVTSNGITSKGGVTTSSGIIIITSGSSAAVTALRGQTVRLPCPLPGALPGAVTWLGPDGLPPSISARDGQLTVAGVAAADGGRYECRIGAAAATVRLTVHAAPELLSAPADTVVRSGSEVRLPCSAAGDPDPVLFWSPSGSDQLLFPGRTLGSATVFSNGTLHIKSVRERDEQLWSCFALSEAGAAVSRGYVWVSEDADAGPGRVSEVRTSSDRASLSCPLDDNGARPEWSKGGRRFPESSRATVDHEGQLILTGLDEAATGTYQCSVTSSLGVRSTARVRLRVSSRPGALTSLATLTSAEAVNSSAVRLQLQVSPALERPAELRVLYGALPSGGYHVTRLRAERASAAVIAGLRSDTVYWFLVLPVTGGRPQLPSNVLLQRTAPVGSAPHRLEARPVNSSAAVVSWLPPTDVSAVGDLREYRVLLRRSGPASATDETGLFVGARTTQVTLGGLTGAAHYTVTVSAETTAGTGASSAPLTFTLAPIADTAPAQPPYGLLGGRWFRAALAGLLSLLLLLATAALLVCLYRHRRGRALNRAVGEKRPEGLALLPSGVRPASWMEGAAWTGSKSEPPSELSCRALPAFDASVPPPLPPLTAPSPYATTAILDTVYQSTEHVGPWSCHRLSSRESLPSFQRPAPLGVRSQSSDVLLGRAGRQPPGPTVTRGSGVPLHTREPPLAAATLESASHRDWPLPALPAAAPRSASCNGRQWASKLVHASCSRHSLAPGSDLRPQPPRSRSFACPPRSARPRQGTGHYVSTALSGDLSATYGNVGDARDICRGEYRDICRGDTRDICGQYDPSSFATSDR